MQGKILGICATLVAFGAFAVLPAVGSAATLTDTVGGVTQKPAPGAKIIAQSTGPFLSSAESSSNATRTS
jgi:hypothetical protein